MEGTMGNIEQRQELATVMPRPLHTAKATLSSGTTRCASFSGRAGLRSVGVFVRLWLSKKDEHYFAQGKKQLGNSTRRSVAAERQ